MANSNRNAIAEARAQAAFERVKPLLAKLAPQDLLQVNLDISLAVRTILAALPRGRALRKQLVKELPFFDIGSFDRLEDYALALSATQAAYLAVIGRPSDLRAVTGEAIQLREMLAKDAEALAGHNLIDGAPLASLKGNGYKNIVRDLQFLSKFLQDAWPQIRGKVATTTQELKTASQLATRIVDLLEPDRTELDLVSDDRSRAFTLVLRTYEDARRAITYLRAAQRDADTILPSLYSGRPRPPPPEAAGRRAKLHSLGK